MASSKLPLLRRLFVVLNTRSHASSLFSYSTYHRSHRLVLSLNLFDHTIYKFPFAVSSRRFCSPVTKFGDESQGPAAIDYSSLLQEDEFHRLADSTLNDLQEKLEDYGDHLQIDGFDVDYGDHVLTLKLGCLGAYVLNKQTPNRQIWMSSPVSGPSRFDWNQNRKAWIYRRNASELLNVLQNELQELCGKQVSLSYTVD